MDYRYKNKYGRIVEVPEELASKIHSKMEFVGRSDGKKIPPPAISQRKGEFVEKFVIDEQGNEIPKSQFFKSGK